MKIHKNKTFFLLAVVFMLINDNINVQAATGTYLKTVTASGYPCISGIAQSGSITYVVKQQQSNNGAKCIAVFNGYNATTPTIYPISGLPSSHINGLAVSNGTLYLANGTSSIYVLTLVNSTYQASAINITGLNSEVVQGVAKYGSKLLLRLKSSTQKNIIAVANINGTIEKRFTVVAKNASDYTYQDIYYSAPYLYLAITETSTLATSYVYKYNISSVANGGNVQYDIRKTYTIDGSSKFEVEGITKINDVLSFSVELGGNQDAIYQDNF